MYGQSHQCFCYMFSLRSAVAAFGGNRTVLCKLGTEFLRGHHQQFTPLAFYQSFLAMSNKESDHLNSQEDRLDYEGNLNGNSSLVSNCQQCIQVGMQ